MWRLQKMGVLAGAASFCALCCALALAAAPAIGAPGDGAEASYAAGTGAANTFDVTIKNTGGTSQRYDYVQLPSGNSVSACEIKTGPKTASCSPGGAGPGTAEAILGAGLPPGGIVVFSFTATQPIPCPTDLSGGINSTSDPGQYTIVPFTFAGSCGGGGSSQDPIDIERIVKTLNSGGGRQLIAEFVNNSPLPADSDFLELSPSPPPLKLFGGSYEGHHRAALIVAKPALSSTIAAGKSYKLIGKLTKKAQALMRHRAKLKVKMKFEFRNSAGASQSFTRKLTIKGSG